MRKLDLDLCKIQMPVDILFHNRNQWNHTIHSEICSAADINLDSSYNYYLMQQVPERHVNPEFIPQVPSGETMTGGFDEETELDDDEEPGGWGRGPSQVQYPNTGRHIVPQ
jgi:hypothetical protein